MAETTKKMLKSHFNSYVNLFVETCTETRWRGYQLKSSKTIPSWPSCK